MNLTSLFNQDLYLALNPDVADAVASGAIGAREHFDLFGKDEGRIASLWFNPNDYLAANSDVAAAVNEGLTNAYDHFANYGMFEGRSPFSAFDGDYYLSANPDVANALGNSLQVAIQHFMEYGWQELRNFNDDIDMSLWQSVGSDSNPAGFFYVNPDWVDAFKEGGKNLYELLLELAESVNSWIDAEIPQYQADPSDSNGSQDDFDLGDFDLGWLEVFLEGMVAGMGGLMEDVMGAIDYEGLIAFLEGLESRFDFNDPNYFDNHPDAFFDFMAVYLSEIYNFIDFDALGDAYADYFAAMEAGFA